MTYIELAKLIQDKYNFINQPTEDELKEIVYRITENTKENEFDEIVFNIVEDTSSIAFESINMSSTISILDQIKAALKK